VAKSQRTLQGSAGNTKGDFSLPGQAPRERKYRYKDHGVDRYGIPPDDRCFKPGAQIQVIRPVYEGRSLIIRPLPMFCAEDPTTLDPYRIGVEPGEYGDWLRSYPCVRFAGEEKSLFTFICYDPYNVEYDTSGNPYLLVRRIAHSETSEDGEAPRYWDKLTRVRQAMLPNVRKMTFLQALVFKQDKDLYIRKNGIPRGLDAKDPIPVIELPGSGMKGINKMLSEEAENYHGDPNDWERRMKHGDPVALDKGRFFIIWNPAKDDVELETDDDGAADWQSRRKAEGEDDNENKGYESIVSPVMISNGKKLKYSPAIGPEQFKHLAKKIQWWDDILDIPDNSKIALYTAMALRGFRDVRKLLDMAWAEHEEYFTPEVEAVLKNASRKTSGKPTAEDVEDTDEADDKPARARSKGVSGTTSEKRRPRYDDAEKAIKEADEELEDEDTEEVEEDTDDQDVVPADDVVDDDTLADDIEDDDEEADEEESEDDDEDDEAVEDEDDEEEPEDEDDEEAVDDEEDDSDGDERAEVEEEQPRKRSKRDKQLADEEAKVSKALLEAQQRASGREKASEPAKVGRPSTPAPIPGKKKKLGKRA